MLPSRSKVYAEQMVVKVFNWLPFVKVFISLQETLGRAEALREKAAALVQQMKLWHNITRKIREKTAGDDHEVPGHSLHYFRAHRNKTW